MSMHADYQHSRKKVIDGGGAVYMKFLASVESCSLPIKTKAGETTNLREIVTSFIDPSGKPRIANMSPMPATEDAGSIYTNFTTHRASTSKVSTEIAMRSEEFIRQEMASAIWNILPPSEARKVLAPSICGKLAMAESVTLEEVADNMPMFPTENVEAAEQDLEDNSVHSEYAAMSVASGITMGSERTSASTRKRLLESLDERDKLEEENEMLHDNVAEQQGRIENLIELLGAQNLDGEALKQLQAITGAASRESTEVDPDKAGREEEVNIMETEEKRKITPEEDTNKGGQHPEENRASATAKAESDVPVEGTADRNSPMRFKRTARKSTQSGTPSQGSRWSPRNGAPLAVSNPNSEGRGEARGSQGEVATGDG